MRVREMLDESVIKVEMESGDKNKCFEEMIDLLVRANRISDPAAALAAVRQRESAGTTGIGKGCAVPHGKHASIKGVTMALGTSSKGIEFDSVDGAPVHAVFLILAGVKEPGPHVRALAEVARLMSTPDVYRRLVEAPSARAVLDVLYSEK